MTPRNLANRKQTDRNQPDGCPDPVELARWAAGLLPSADAARVTRHVAECPGCGEGLKLILGEYEPAPGPEEIHAVESLASATPAGRKALAGRLRQRRGLPPLVRKAAAITGVAIALGVCWSLWRNGRATPEQLVARAYSANRPFTYRLSAGGSPGPVRIPRSAIGLTDLPPLTVEALARAQEALAKYPDDPAQLLAAGEARLLAMDLRGAGEILERARRQQPLNDAAVASFATLIALRSEREEPAGPNSPLLQQALLLLDACAQRRPANAAVCFNRALVLKRMDRIEEAANELRRCLSAEADPAWLTETRGLLDTFSRH